MFYFRSFSPHEFSVRRLKMATKKPDKQNKKSVAIDIVTITCNMYLEISIENRRYIFLLLLLKKQTLHSIPVRVFVCHSQQQKILKFATSAFIPKLYIYYSTNTEILLHTNI